MDITFTAPSAGGTVKITLKNQDPTDHPVYYDDIRLQPFKSAITTYVYDPKTLWITGELDNRNFATFYNYDEEGAVVQVKKETKNGIMTIKSTRSNTYKK